MRSPHKLILIGSGVTHAHLRVHLQGMPSPVRDSPLWQGKGGVSQVSRYQAGTAAFRFCGVRKRFVAFCVPGTCLRILRRSPRPRRLLPRRYELARPASLDSEAGCSCARIVVRTHLRTQQKLWKWVRRLGNRNFRFRAAHAVALHPRVSIGAEGRESLHQIPGSSGESFFWRARPQHLGSHHTPTMRASGDRGVGLAFLEGCLLFCRARACPPGHRWLRNPPG